MGDAEIDQGVLPDQAHDTVMIDKLADVDQQKDGDALGHEIVCYVLIHSLLSKIGDPGIDDDDIYNEQDQRKWFAIPVLKQFAFIALVQISQEHEIQSDRDVFDVPWEHVSPGKDRRSLVFICHAQDIQEEDPEI